MSGVRKTKRALKSNIDPRYDDATAVYEYRKYHDDVEHVKTYRELLETRDDWVKLSNAIILVGPRGTGKSESFKRNFKGFYRKGHSTTLGLYLDLYHHRDKLIMLDDVGEILSDPTNIELLKSLLETQTVKTVSWRTSRELPEDVPNSFDTRSRVALITNDLGSINEHLSAVLDRTFVIKFVPTPLELHNYVGTWFKDQDVYDYIGANLSRLRHPSCRFYIHASEKKKVGRDWKAWIERGLVPSVASDTIRELEVDSITTRIEKARLFAERTGLSESHYYTLRRMVLSADDRRPNRKTGRKPKSAC